MKIQQKIDKILKEVNSRVQEEVGALMGAEFKLANPSAQLISKGDYFDEQTGKKIVAKLDITGEIEGAGGLVVSVKDAIRLGGTLIMIPSGELDELVKNESYSEEVEDSYGEIANIIAGSYTKVFEELFPQDCRFVRKEQETVSPVKVDEESDEPFPSQNYYWAQSSMVLNGVEMANLDVLLPAESFGLEVAEEKAAVEEEGGDSSNDVKAVAAEKESATAPPPPETEPQAEKEQEPSAADSPKASEKKAPTIQRKNIQKKIDKTLLEVTSRVKEEVGALMGASFKLSNPFSRLIQKDDYFEEQSGKKIVARLDITGEIEGVGGLVVSVKDAIRLGATLIMLPSGELEDVVKNENYSEEIEDSYGEIANIIAGSYTKVFEELFPHDCRFVRKEQETVSPVKVASGSDKPIPDQWYYWVESKMVLDEVEMGGLDILMPAEPFGLEIPVEEKAGEEEKSEVHDGQGDDAVQETVTAGAETGEETADGPSDVEQREKHSSSKDGTGQPAVLKEDLGKQKKLVDKLLKACKENIGQETGALLGVDVQLGQPENQLVSKEEVFEEVLSGKQMLANMDVTGDREGESFLFVSLKDAIRIGSTLIMLPPSELEAAVNEEEVTADTEDAYGEIANIIAGVYTAVFQDQFSDSLRFIKRNIEIVAPLKVDTESDDVIPTQYYYLSSCQLSIDGVDYGNMVLLLPADIIGLEGLLEEGESDEQEFVKDAPVGDTASPTGSHDDGGRGAGEAEVLIIENNGAEADKIQAELRNIGFRSKRISFNDSINDHIRESLRLVIIVMREVDEQAYGMTIKVNSMCSLPIVAAGSEWTRSKVIKAVKYGVGDILLTPAERSDIQEKVNSNIRRLAA